MGSAINSHSEQSLGSDIQLEQEDAADLRQHERCHSFVSDGSFQQLPSPGSQTQAKQPSHQDGARSCSPFSLAHLEPQGLEPDVDGFGFEAEWPRSFPPARLSLAEPSRASAASRTQLQASAHEGFPNIHPRVPDWLKYPPSPQVNFLLGVNDAATRTEALIHVPCWYDA